MGAFAGEIQQRRGGAPERRWRRTGKRWWHCGRRPHARGLAGRQHDVRLAPGRGECGPPPGDGFRIPWRPSSSPRWCVPANQHWPVRGRGGTGGLIPVDCRLALRAGGGDHDRRNQDPSLPVRHLPPRGSCCLDASPVRLGRRWARLTLARLPGAPTRTIEGSKSERTGAAAGGHRLFVGGGPAPILQPPLLGPPSGPPGSSRHRHLHAAGERLSVALAHGATSMARRWAAGNCSRTRSEAWAAACHAFQRTHLPTGSSPGLGPVAEAATARRRQEFWGRGPRLGLEHAAATLGAGADAPRRACFRCYIVGRRLLRRPGGARLRGVTTWLATDSWFPSSQAFLLVPTTSHPSQ